MPGPRKKIVRHLDEDGLAAAIDRAQQTGQARLVRRLCFLRNLYAGDSVTEAAARVGVSQPTGSRWTDAWNEAGVGGLEPAFDGGRPPKLDETARERLTALLERYQPLTTSQVRRLLEDGFGIVYSERHVRRILGEIDCLESIEDRDRGTEHTEAVLERNLRRALAELDEGTDMDGRKGPETDR